jgi:hypothetical protein
MLWHVIRHIYSLEVAVKDHHLNTLHLSHYNSQIEKLLRVWSGKRKLRIIRFYFWNSGTIEQRSQAGLLRSLLSECFIQDPELIPVVLLPLWTKYYSELISKVYVKDPDAETTWDDGRTWSDLQKTGERLSGDWQTWTMDSLMHAFTLLLEQDTIPTKLCIFVDGLDEYDGDHHTIATLFKRVASSPYVKVCVSSRPLLPFEDAFNTGPRLRLQDLTQDDIKHYVKSKFNKNLYFRRFALEQPAQAEAIVKDIVAKADGVFLWVVLVVVSLLEGLSNRDEISYLQQRIDLLPRDLESLFTTMLSKVPVLYRTSTPELFQIFHCARNYEKNAGTFQRLPVFDLLSLAYSAEADSESAVKAESKAVPTEEIGMICSNMEARLKVRTMGLLEVPNSCSEHVHRGSEFCGAVQYLHRTVRDYLESREVKTSLLQQTHGTDFNPHNSLLRAYVRRLKGYVDFGHYPQKYFAAAMTHAYFVEFETSEVEVYLLDGLKVAREKSFPDSFGIGMSFPFPATQYSLCSYIKEMLRHEKKVPKVETGSPLLYALFSQRGNWSKGCGPSVRMVSLLLQCGSNPNETYCGDTPWSCILKVVYLLSKEKRLGEPNLYGHPHMWISSSVYWNTAQIRDLFVNWIRNTGQLNGLLCMRLVIFFRRRLRCSMQCL